MTYKSLTFWVRRQSGEVEDMVQISENRNKESRPGVLSFFDLIV